MHLPDLTPGATHFRLWHHHHPVHRHCPPTNCDAERAEVRRARGVARDLYYQVTRLDGRLRPVVVEPTIEVQPSPPVAEMHVARAYAVDPVGAAPRHANAEPPPAVVIHLDSVLQVTNLGTLLDVIA